MTAARTPLRSLLVLALLALALAAGVLVHPLAGIAVAALGALLLWKPFDPVVALAGLAAVASFVNNEGGQLTRDLAVVTLAALYALVSVALARIAGRWRAPGGALTAALAVFMAWTALSAARGVLAGHSLRYTGLELAGLGVMVFAWLAGGLRVSAAELRPARVVLLVAGLGHVALGVWSYAVNHVRTGGLWYTPLPGMLAVFALVFALHARRGVERWGWTLLMGLYLLHQTISFSRGYWLGLLVALPFVAIAFARRGPGSAPRWRRVGAVTLLAGSLAAVTTAGTALVFGWSDLPAMLGTRFGSSFETKDGGASASNVARLLEYAASFRQIQQSPWIGHGMGQELRIRNPIFHVTTRQWYVHHTYLWLWIKQGVVGVLLLLVLLWQAMRLGLRGARSPDDEKAAWALAMAGATLYFGVVNLTTYHLAQVNASTLQALLWGFALALSRPPHWKLVWSAAPAADPRTSPA